MPVASLMEEEALSAPDRVAAVLEEGVAERRALVAALLAEPPALGVTVGRGSSDHVCSFAAWTFLRRLRLPTMSLQPSLVTRDGAEPRVERALMLAVSQSGQGADVIGVTAWGRSAGARTVALVNDPASPLAAAAEFVLDQRAGPERSVAATKSVICSMAGVLALAADLSDDDHLHRVLGRLPSELHATAAAGGGLEIGPFAGAEHAFVLARGAGLAAGAEIALKLKETCGLSAEALSAAEVRHGPREVVGPGFLVVALALPGPTEGDVRTAAAELAAQGASVIMLGCASDDTWRMPTVDPVSAPLAALQLAYPAIARAAQARQRDPDRPRTLSKVTSTF
ncbi:MAG TPA: SIS domain-containing protein [Geminicoccus sp.]|uniref:SIS domain-containing protein n=1 Tax=Geminicoccus sp. TaxID=2024832 RepID=UPI002E34FFDE|nr:SIS domain-containing protein [Geminicoccus sp.]HEX2525756.1 SIS domain-containing protein [Geminicoccus sp.]